jgi:hypothetical protein
MYIQQLEKQFPDDHLTCTQKARYNPHRLYIARHVQRIFLYMYIEYVPIQKLYILPVYRCRHEHSYRINKNCRKEMFTCIVVALSTRKVGIFLNTK